MANKVVMPTWQPITDPIDLRHLAKLGEELGECSAIVSRTICQGLLECDPSSGSCNIDALADEIADVLASIDLARERFNLSKKNIEERREYKKRRLKLWHYGFDVEEDKP